MINDAMQSGCFIGTAGLRFIHHMKRFTLKRRGTNLEKLLAFAIACRKKEESNCANFPIGICGYILKSTKKDVHSFLAKKLL